MDMKQSIALIVFSLLLSSCVVGPNYKRPGVIVPSKFKEAKGKAFVFKKHKDWTIAAPSDAIDRGKWWTIFNDSSLNALEDKLNCSNQTIANALANYIQARQIVNEVRAGFFPTVSGIFSALRQKTGGGSSSLISTTAGGVTTTGTATTGSVAQVPIILTSFSSIINANWEPDIWGIVHRTVEGAEAAAQSSQALLDATRLSTQGSLAEYYFELATLDKDQELLNKTVVDYQISLKLTKYQYSSGVASRADIVQAQSQLEIAKAQAINNGILRSQYEHAIAVLIGLPPADFSMPFKPLTAKPPVIPVTIPSVWLERRPDIAEAERLMQQTNARIGLAMAAYYPSLNLSGSPSAGGRTFSALIHSPNVGWAYGMQIAQIIFDGGYIKATINAAKAGYLAQVAAYRQTVLTAFQNVEDNLAALRILEKESVEQNKAAASAVYALQLVTNQFKAGTVDYASVITSQITAYSAQKTAYDIMGLQMASAVSLIISMGGGWSTQDIDLLRGK